MPPIHIAAAVIANEQGEVLLVRKQGTSVFIQPGGKLEAGETPLSALARELHEELGVELDATMTCPLGGFEDDAVHEPGQRVHAQAYACTVRGTPSPQAEIEELAWVDPHGPHRLPIAPLSRKHILPAFLARVEQRAGGDKT